ncbi:hypothetical protein GCM10027577_45160 [Spirosoma fluminis]
MLKRCLPMNLFLLLGLLSCDNWKAIRAGTFKGAAYQLQSLETKGFSTNRIDYAIKLDGEKRVVIDAMTTDWGPPYADDLYGKARRVYIDKNHQAYSNEPDDPQRHPSTMLYLSPERFTEAAFERYAELLKREWPRIDRQFSRDEADRFPQIIGLVYGNQQDFVRVFRGKQDGKNYEIKVEVDGRIRYSPDQEWSNDEYSGLSEKVQMPGKRIYVATGKETGIPLAQVLTYRDAVGKSLGDYFQLLAKSDTLSNK